MTSQLIDVAIIGAGPAGMTAALYASRAGYAVTMFERISPGGQLAQTEHLENYPGYTDSMSGFDLAMAMHEQAASFGAVTVTEEVTAVDFSCEPKKLITAFNTYEAKSVIIATGARPSKLGLELEEELRGKGVSYCATCDGNFFRGRDVAIIGGGNTAAADAIYLANICRTVYLVHRRDTLRATAIYHKRLEDLPNVQFCWDSEARSIISQGERVEGLIIENNKTGQRTELPCDAVFIAVGNVPNTEFLEGALDVTSQGYIITDELGHTAVPGVYAAGDVRTKELRQVITAASDGANCAEEAAGYLADVNALLDAVES